MLTLSMSNCSPCFRKSEEQDFFVKVLHKPSHSSNLLCIYYLNYFFRVSFLDPDIFGCVFLKILNRHMCPDSAFSCQLSLPHSEESPLKALSNLKPILSSLPLDPGSQLLTPEPRISVFMLPGMWYSVPQLWEANTSFIRLDPLVNFIMFLKFTTHKCITFLCIKYLHNKNENISSVIFTTTKLQHVSSFDLDGKAQ